MKRSLSFITLWLVGLSMSSHAAQIGALQFTSGELATLEEQACRKPHDVGLQRAEGRVYGKGANSPAVAEVHCAPHAMLSDMPMHYVAQCAREKGVWECQGEWTEIAVALQPREVATRVEQEVKPAQAVNIIRKIASSGRFQGYVLRDALVSPCYVTQTKNREFIDVKCEGWHMIVSTWCPQQPSDCPRLLSIDKQI
jgi:hypothetical protein